MDAALPSAAILNSGLARRLVPVSAELNEIGRNVGLVELGTPGLRGFVNLARIAAPEHVGRESAEGNGPGRKGLCDMIGGNRRKPL